ncbi:hypothetical protein GGTG_07272 [Gaeumannomyces tritici R3-111a-1]|uniref:tripeptidyl-peptidase II n=1 Tax=Gaeumannomyces tritici (strain R3-111a-1) TaxID=644352 RepID=J3P175_GAET3|nr:hypothetical protein GGTG_07272 [Gaeumannomyces tritici R3-111a-1]EJT77360.1 hypothetical protein GGTG_07272 [Gaeumannomyces tritici R3-111a-1]
MWLLSTTVALGGLLGAAVAAVLPAAAQQQPNLFVHEKATAAALARWEYLAPAPDSARVHLSVALRQPGMKELRARLDAVSDPAHAEYGMHLSRDQVAAFVDPGADAVSAVTAWLEGAGIAGSRYEDADARVSFDTTVAAANRLLGCKLSTYKEKESNKRVVRAEEYSLPRALAEVVDFVYPVTQFISSPKKPQAVEVESADLRKRQDTLPKSCSVGYITPDCLVDLYNINYKVPDNQSPVEFGIAGFLEEYPDQPHLTSFMGDYSPRRNETGFSPVYNFTMERINGVPTRPNGPGVEALLDVQYSMPFLQPMNVTFFSTAGRGPDQSGPNRTLLPESQSAQEPWADLLTHLIARPAVPQVVSVSYTDDEQDIPEAYARRVCDLFAQVAARGVSVLVATGDGGAAGIRSSACLANDGSGRRKFIPTFPVGCPYVTAVGATGTYLPTEPAWFSSGGFSEYFARPSWQDAAVAGYLARINGSHAGWYEAGGRAYPDVSAVGSRFLMERPPPVGREWTQKGTSASTPVIAAMVALANDKRMRAGKPPLGFLNPLLYSEQLRGAFNDVKSGTSGSCSAPDYVEFGWDALEGWDPATGMGTLDFARFVDALA